MGSYITVVTSAFHIQYKRYTQEYTSVYLNNIEIVSLLIHLVMHSNFPDIHDILGSMIGG